MLFEEKDGAYSVGHAPNYVKVYTREDVGHNEIRTVTAAEVFRDGVLGTVKHSS